MTKDEVFITLKEVIKEVLPLNDQEITIDKSLTDLGANSIDRAEIVINVMSKLNITVPAQTLATVKNIAGLVDALYEAQQKA